MDVNLKNIEIATAFQSLGGLTNLDLPIKTSFSIARNTKKIESAFKIFSECENQLIKKYAIKNESGEIKIDENYQYRIEPKFVDKFKSERNELFNCDNKIDIFMIKSSDLQDEENKNKIKPATLLSLYFMIDEDEENDK